MNKTLSFIAVFGIVLGLSASGSAQTVADISGTWKIDSQNGPIPICGIKQVGNNLTGSCVGPQGAGTITGTVVGELVRWRWEAVLYEGNAIPVWEFVVVWKPDNTMSGTFDRREIGLSVPARAVRFWR